MADGLAGSGGSHNLATCQSNDEDIPVAAATFGGVQHRFRHLKAPPVLADFSDRPKLALICNLHSGVWRFVSQAQEGRWGPEQPRDQALLLRMTAPNQHAQVTRRHQPPNLSRNTPSVPEPVRDVVSCKNGQMAWHSTFETCDGHLPRPRNARQDTRACGYQTPDAREPEALIVNKSADETPRGWYCACCSTSETTHAHVHVPLCPFSPMSKSKSLSGFPLHGEQGHARPASEKPEPCPHSVTTDFADRKALRTRGRHPWSSCHHCSGCQNRSVKMLRQSVSRESRRSSVVERR